MVREFCGHGIGQKFHEEPQVLHYGRPGTLEELVPGMTFTIEPMINAGKRDVEEPWQRRLDHRHHDHSLCPVGTHRAGHPTGYEVMTFVGRVSATA